LGGPVEQQTGLFLWDTTDGNVILQTGELNEGFVLGLFLTRRPTGPFELAPHAGKRVTCF